MCRLHEPPTPRPGRRTARSTEATIVDFYIAAEHRRQGLGRRLYVYATDRLGEAGVREVNLGVLVANDAGLVFWRSMGFEPYRLQLRRQLDPPLGRDRGLAGQ